MGYKLGDRAGSLEMLRGLRDRLVRTRVTAAEQERWETLSGDAQRIVEACDSKDLEQVAVAVRTIKNRMRRPAIRKELARLDEEKKDKEIKPKGKCQCANCGKTIDGSKEPCLDGALCTKCGMDGKVPKGEKEKEKGAVPDKEKKDDVHVGESNYRRRSY